MPCHVLYIVCMKVVAAVLFLTILVIISTISAFSPLLFMVIFKVLLKNLIEIGSRSEFNRKVFYLLLLNLAGIFENFR